MLLTLGWGKDGSPQNLGGLFGKRAPTTETAVSIESAAVHCQPGVAQTMWSLPILKDRVHYPKMVRSLTRVVYGVCVQCNDDTLIGFKGKEGKCLSTVACHKNFADMIKGLVLPVVCAYKLVNLDPNPNNAECQAAGTLGEHTPISLSTKYCTPLHHAEEPLT